MTTSPRTLHRPDRNGKASRCASRSRLGSQRHDAGPRHRNHGALFHSIPRRTFEQRTIHDRSGGLLDGQRGAGKGRRHTRDFAKERAAPGSYRRWRRRNRSRPQLDQGTRRRAAAREGTRASLAFLSGDCRFLKACRAPGRPLAAGRGGAFCRAVGRRSNRELGREGHAHDEGEVAGGHRFSPTRGTTSSSASSRK